MTKQEFKEFCQDECVKRGFKKKKSMYYLAGPEVLCGIAMQKSNYGSCYYVEYNFFIGKYEDPSRYPTSYEADIYHRITVLSKDTIDGQHFMDALIEYEKYDIIEIEPYFKQTFDDFILPPVLEGVSVFLEKKSHYFSSVFPKDYDKVMGKIQKIKSKTS